MWMSCVYSIKISENQNQNQVIGVVFIQFNIYYMRFLFDMILYNFNDFRFDFNFQLGF